MATKYEGKNVRKVETYRRVSSTGKKVQVKDYYQRYNKPRGPVKGLKVDPSTSKNRTAWLKDSKGRFIGRSNSEGKTSAKKSKVASYGVDRTRNVRDAKAYGRIFGRSKQSR